MDLEGEVHVKYRLGILRHVFVLLNPITNERTAITFPNGWGAHNVLAEYHGFGYSPSTNEYKLFKSMRIFSGGDGEFRDEYAIFTIGVDERWRRLPPNLFPAYETGICDDPTVCNGAFHWLVNDKFEGHYCLLILAFDIATENTTGRIPTPLKSRMHSRVKIIGVEGSPFVLQRGLITGLHGESNIMEILLRVVMFHIWLRSQARELFAGCATKSGKLVFKAETLLGIYCPKQMSHNVIQLPYHYDITRLYEFTPTFSSINEIVYGRSIEDATY